MISQRRGCCPLAPIHGNKFGTNQSGACIRVVARIADSDFLLAQHGGGAIHDIAYIFLP
jgi:hypothetical protein